jgi:hypothetical protein
MSSKVKGFFPPGWGEGWPKLLAVNTNVSTIAVSKTKRSVERRIGPPPRKHVSVKRFAPGDQICCTLLKAIQS